MSFPSYERYKNSGVEWLGEVPKHWSIERLHATVNRCKNGVWGDEEAGDEWDIPCVRVADFDRDKLTVKKTIPTLRNVLEGDRRGRTLQRGDLLLEKSGGGDSQPVGCVVLYDHDQEAVCSNFVARMQLASGMNPSYCRYLHASIYELRLTTRSINQTSGIQNLDQYSYLSELVALPKHEEQVAIALFLERETAKIDALIEEQRRLIELLKEKRQAVISHAVTKGLDSGIPMKNSDVEWLGEIPEHWPVYILKRTLTSMDYGISESLDSQGAIAVLRMGNIQEGKIVTNDMKYIGEVDSALLLREGDLLYNRTNSLDLIGKVGMFLGGHHGLVSFASYLVRLRMVESSTPAFFAYLLNTEGVLALARSNAFVAIGQCNLNPTRYSQIAIAVPPLSEQNEIVTYLDTQTFQINLLTNEAKAAIEILQERRSALISAAVTGKIDVRNYTPKEAA